MTQDYQATYKNEYHRYRHYYHRLWVLYQKPEVKVSFALILTVFTIVFFAVFAIRPTLITVAELIKRIQDRQEVLTKLEQKAAQLSAAQQEYLSAQAQLPLLDQALPPDPDAQNLIKLIEGTAAYHGVVLTNFGLGEVTFPPQTQATPEEIHTLPLTLTATADYPTLNAFIQSLSQLIREIRIQSLTLTPDEEEGTSPSNVLTATLTGEALYYPVSP